MIDKDSINRLEEIYSEIRKDVNLNDKIHHIRMSQNTINKLCKMFGFDDVENIQEEPSSLYGIPYRLSKEIRDNLLVFYNYFDEIIKIIMLEEKESVDDLFNI